MNVPGKISDDGLGGLSFFPCTSGVDELNFGGGGGANGIILGGGGGGITLDDGWRNFGGTVVLSLAPVSAFRFRDFGGCKSCN